LEGALVALSTSNFLNVAGTELTLKMIRATSTKSGIASQLFSQRRNEYETQDSKERKLIPLLAKEIVENPKAYSVGIATAAATYLAEHYQVSLPPLLTLENEIGLQVQQPTNT
jgi:hypothetical protein